MYSGNINSGLPLQVIRARARLNGLNDIDWGGFFGNALSTAKDIYSANQAAKVAAETQKTNLKIAQLQAEQNQRNSMLNLPLPDFGNLTSSGSNSMIMPLMIGAVLIAGVYLVMKK